MPSMCIGAMHWCQQHSMFEAREELHDDVEERGITFLDTAEFYPIPPTRRARGVVGPQLLAVRAELLPRANVSPRHYAVTREVVGGVATSNIE